MARTVTPAIKAAILGAVGLGAFMFTKSAAAAAAPASPPAADSAQAPGYAFAPIDLGSASDEPAPDKPAPYEIPQFVAPMDPRANERAFLAMIAAAEGTARAAQPYRVCFGYRHTVADMADHPAITGEWRGEKLPDRMCEAAGRGPGCVSTAAGRYQIIVGTWQEAKRAASLPDFSPDSQDRAALWLIDRAGALQAVRAGMLADAVNKCRRTWASLPGAGYGQPERPFAALADAYVNAGGAIA